MYVAYIMKNAVEANKNKYSEFKHVGNGQHNYEVVRKYQN
jgi:hypothetical protein